MHQVLLAEPDTDTAADICTAFNTASLMVTHRRHGVSALNEGRRQAYSVILAEKVLPGRDGLTVCEQLRSEGVETPILLMSHQPQSKDIIEALAAGADGYISKPFSQRELVARVEALIRRQPRSQPQSITLGDLVIDAANRIVIYDGHPVALRRREYNILHLLASNPDRAFTRAQINNRTASGWCESDDSCIDVHISNLRKTLLREGAGDPIETVYGVGYRLRKTV